MKVFISGILFEVEHDYDPYYDSVEITEVRYNHCDFTDLLCHDVVERIRVEVLDRARTAWSGVDHKEEAAAEARQEEQMLERLSNQ